MSFIGSVAAVARRYVLSAAVLVIVSVAARPAAAQTVDKVFPRAPIDDQTTSPRPVFRIGVEGSEPIKMRFKIELSRDDFETVVATFDQLEEGNGWSYDVMEDVSGGMYRTRKPLEDGPYQWKASAWNGVEWVTSKAIGSFYVDATPPADVDGIRMSVNRKDQRIELEWDPVVLDRNGRPERVRLYKIYRYEKRSIFFSIRYFQIGVTDQTYFEDPDPNALSMPLLFYKISAEDEAGNEHERRY